ncbi:MAG: amidohydrolase family protein [Acidobacteriota bacterium]
MKGCNLKRWMVLFAVGLLLSPLFALAGAEDDSDLFLSSDPKPVSTPNEVLIKGATVWTLEGRGILSNTDVLIRDGKISRIGRNLSAGSDAVVIEARGKHVTPGLIDAHSHAAVEGFGVNEGAHSVTAEVRVADVLDPTNRFIYLGLSGGLTVANVLHGSANAIGGQNAVIKMRWGVDDPDQLLIDTAPPGIKFALGENPKRSNFPSLPGMTGRYPKTRMGVAATIRNAFRQAQRYREEWEHYDSLPRSDQEHTVPPRRNLQLDTLVEVLEGKRLVHSHCYRADEILMLLRLAEEFKVRIQTLQHVLEGYRVADEIARHGAGASTFSDWWSYKMEAYEAIPYNAALMRERGVLVSLNSDNPNLARRMNVEAAKTLRYGGLSPEQALALVTINPAKQLRIDDRVGSLAAGKDADVVVWNGDPLSIFSSVDYTFVDGKLLFSRQADTQHREQVKAARERLVEEIKNEGKKPEKSEEEEEEKEASGEELEKAAEQGGEEQAAPPESAPASAPEEGEIPVDPASPTVDYTFSPFVNSRPVAIVGATVHTLEGDAIPSGVVIFDKGKITSVGGKQTRVPSGARRIDGRGKHLWPGVIQMRSVLGLSEINSVAGSVDTAEMGDWNANIDPIVAVQAASTHIPVTRSGGITHAVVAPSGGVVAGSAALIRMDGWTWEELQAVPRHSLVIQWPGSSQNPFAFFFGRQQSLEDRQKTARKKEKELEKFFKDAELYGKAKAEAERKGLPWEEDPQFEAMQPVIRKEKALFVVAGAGWVIRDAVDWALERELRIVIVGGAEAWKVADFLAQRQVPVVLTGVTSPPSRSDEPYQESYSEAAKLAAAGVLVAIAGTDTPGGSSNARQLPSFAGLSAAFGLDKESAYKTITLNPARILGLEKVLGSISVGKSASLVLTDGDLLEPGTRIEQVWIDGNQPSMRDKHKDLYDKYRSRPKPRNE